MKLNISFNEQMSGYRNINILNESVNLGKLDDICGPAECIEIVVSVLNYIPHNSLLDVVKHLESRLRHGGRLIIIFNQLDAIIRKYSMGEIDEEKLNVLLYGAGHKSVFSSEYIVNLLSIKLTSAKIDDEKVTLIAERE